MLNDNEEDNHLTPPKKIMKNPTKHRAQKFRSEWLRVENLKKWLVPVDNDPFKAKCKLCNFTMVAELSNIKTHGNGKKHKEIEACTEIKQKSIKTFTTNKTPTKLDIDVKMAEIKLTAFLTEHNIAFLATDHLTDVLKSCFKDSEIAKNISLKRTKTTSITKNVIDYCQKEELVSYLKTVQFSILTDESTDIGTVKSSCVILR